MSVSSLPLKPGVRSTVRLALGVWFLLSNACGSGELTGVGDSSDRGGGSHTGGNGTGDGGTFGSGASGASDSGEGGSSSVTPIERDLMAYGANTTVGLEWEEVPDATGYRVYWSTSPGVEVSSAQSFEAEAAGVVHRGLTNGTTYHYVVTVLDGQRESAPSTEVSATPGGEWVLEELGTGRIDDLITGEQTKIPIEKRQHVLLFPEGYTEQDLVIFRGDPADGSDRDNDVDQWIDDVFRISPYSIFKEAFVVWYLPRASATRINGYPQTDDTAPPNTAFSVSVTGSGNSWATGSIPNNGETATRAWQAVWEHPFPPTEFTTGGGGLGTARNFTAAFLILHPTRLEASLSGRALALRDPESSNRRLSSGFGIGHAHEFTHAFSDVRDEYMAETLSGRDWGTSPTTNVVNSNVCAEVPWSHLLEGAGINTTPELVGAFGVEHIGYHAELLCLMNGTHQNGTYFAEDDNGSCTVSTCTLRAETRMCNHCREITAFRVFQRSGIIDQHSEWASNYRSAFFERHGFQVPEVVPQSNDRSRPERGTTIYHPCAQASETAVDTEVVRLEVEAPPAEPHYEGCVLMEP